MRGNVSKVSPKVIQGPDGPKGDTPSIVFKYDADTGDLYFSSDGILADKDYVESQNLVLKVDVPQHAQFVINFDSNFIGDKTFDEVLKAYQSGKEIIGAVDNGSPTQRLYRFGAILVSNKQIRLMTHLQSRIYLCVCRNDVTENNGWIPVQEFVFITRETYDTDKTAIYKYVDDKVAGVKINTATQITDNVTHDQYPTARATKEYVETRLLELVNKVAPSPASVTLYANRWEQNENEQRWHQEVVVANATITEYSKVDLQLSAEQIMIFYEKDLAFVTENDGGKVTVYCIGRVPESDYILQATVSEVVVNG